MARTPTTELNERRREILRVFYEVKRAGKAPPTSAELARDFDFPETTMGNHIRWALAEGYLSVERGPNGERKVRALSITLAGLAFIGESLDDPDPRDVALDLAREYLPQLPEPLRHAVEAVPA